MSSSPNSCSTYTWQRESRAEMTSNEGFSVVAPIRVIVPRSTAPSSESCCALLKRCISSIKRMAPFSCWAALITSRTSFTPLLMALSVWNGRCSVWLIIMARVVLPMPGGPQKIMLGICPLSINVRRTAPGPIRCCCPIYSSRVLGRSISANGTIILTT